MCGILGVFNDNSSDQIMVANKILRKRGPDCGKIIIEPDKILVFRRLSIMDVNSTADQPFVTKKSKLMCNGEIYNFQSLKEKYSLNCKTGSDCEVIIHMAEKLGFPTILPLLDGVYSIIYITNKRVWFARDYVGVRPLFYGITNKGGFALASNALTLQSFCGKIVHLEPGWGYYDIETRSIKTRSYMYPRPTPVKFKTIGFNKIDKKSDILTKYINEILVQAVHKRLMGDRPLGFLLSGGLDSSLIVSIACDLLGPENVKTFSIGIEGSKDLENAQKVAKFLGTQHTVVNFTPDEGFKAIPEVIRDLETYDITTIRASVAMWLLCKYIKNKTDIKILMSGEGADELFCGYLYFHYAPSPKELHKESLRLVKELYKYDVLRADRCVSSHGLELRVPFLDKDIVDLAFCLDGKIKMPKEGFEKDLLRSSF